MSENNIQQCKKELPFSQFRDRVSRRWVPEEQKSHPTSTFLDGGASRKSLLQISEIKHFCVI
jgi:hypothetical protein